MRYVAPKFLNLKGNLMLRILNMIQLCGSKLILQDHMTHADGHDCSHLWVRGSRKNPVGSRETSHRVKHPAVQRSCGNVSGSKRDCLFMMFFLVATTYRTPKVNPPPSFLTNLNQTERSSLVSKEWRTSSTGRQSCAGISGSTRCSSRSTAGRISQSQRSLKKHKFFVKWMGGC